MTNRAVLIGAVASGETTIVGPLFADDTEAMLDVATTLGAKVVREQHEIRIVGNDGKIAPSGQIFARRSGTTARFVAPVLATVEGPWTLDGDDQLSARPMEDLYLAIESMGAHVERPGDDRSLPVVISGPVVSDTVTVPGGLTSQFLSGLLLAAPLTTNGLAISVEGGLKSRPYVELTVGVMQHFGAFVEEERSRYVVSPGGYRGRTIQIEPDASSASYFFAAGAITGGRIRVEGLSRTSVQGDIAFVDYLARMGATVRDDGHSVVVQGGEPLEGITLDASNTTDIVPTLAIVAALATTRTEITGIGFIRAKESDRVGGLVTQLRRCGVEAYEEADGITIEPSIPHGTLVHTSSDHRMAMAFAILGLVVPGIEIDEPECVEKTFPGFFLTLESLRS